MATVLDFFKANVGHPNSIPFMDYIEWNNSTSPVLSVAPANNETVMIRRTHWVWGHSLSWKSNQNDARLIVTQSNTPPSGSLDIYYEDDLDTDGSVDQDTHIAMANITKGHMRHDPPIKLNGPSENLQIQLLTDGGSLDTNGFHKGHLWIALTGWALKTEDF